MKKNKLNLFDKLMLIVAVLAAVGMLLGVLAGSVNPNQNIWLAFAGLAYPFLLIANVIFAIYWLFRKKFFLVFATIISISVGYKTLNSTFQLIGERGENTKAKNEYLRVLTYNVHQFKKYGENNDASTKDQILQVIADQHPDVILFQEFFTRKRGEYDLITAVKDKLGFKYYHFYPTVGNDYEQFGLAIFSKYPLSNKGNIKFQERSANGSIYADVNFHGKQFRLFNVHFQSISFQKEDYDYIDEIANNKEVKVGSARRIASMLKAAFKKRAEQVEIMKAAMDNCTLPYIIGGDFNDTPASYCFTKITDTLRSTFSEQGVGFGKTYNGAFPNFQIDYIAATKNFEVINHYVVKSKLSDHFPVRSDLRLNFAPKSSAENY